MRKLRVATLLAVITQASPVLAQTVSGPPILPPEDPGGTPSSVAGGATPPGGVVVIGKKSEGGDGEAKLSVHGYLRAPLRIGTQKRDPQANQTDRELHTPRLPDDQYLNWSYTGQWPRDWAEMFVSYGTNKVSGTIAFNAFNFTDASYNNWDAQFGISQGFVTLRPDLGIAALRIAAKVGSFWNRYGLAGRYDAGRYDTYLFGRTHAMGEAVTAEYDLGPNGGVMLHLEHGLGARGEQGNCAGAGCNYLASPNGFTMLHHVHGGVTLPKILDVTGHFLSSWSQDGGTSAKKDRPDGSMKVFGGEVTAEGGFLGRIFLGFSRIKADHAAVVGPAIEVIHANGGGFYGLGVADQFLGPKSDGGTGTVDTFLVQYDYSVASLMRFLRDGGRFYGDGPDLTLSLFVMTTKIASLDPDFDGMRKTKFGGDLLWTPLPWLGLGFRADRVQPNSKDGDQSFTVLSPKILLRSRFLAREEITIQYSNYRYGANVVPVAPLQALKPDQNVFGIRATMWW